MNDLKAAVEALLFLSPDPLTTDQLAESCQAGHEEVEAAVASLEANHAADERGVALRRVAGGITFAAKPEHEAPARRLFAKPKTPPLSQAQAECLSIVAYLQPVSRPEIATIRGVSSESAVSALSERGLIEESGRSRFGAVIYRTSELFQKLFGLEALDRLPDIAAFDPSPDDERKLRERLLKAGEQRALHGETS